MQGWKDICGDAHRYVVKYIGSRGIGRQLVARLIVDGVTLQQIQCVIDKRQVHRSN
jgi:hypothetical protein